MQPRIPEVTLLEEVGRGPGSVVFRALHRGRACTVKLPSDRPPHSASATGFEQDLLQFARLTRAGLPRVIQLDVIGETPYAILEPLEGEPFLKALERTGSDAERVKLLLALLTCLQQLHDAGFVHGHLTADNVLISGDGARVTFADRGSVSRTGAHDTHADLRSLGFVLRESGARLPRSAKLTALVRRLADELVAGRARLPAVIAALEAQAGQLARKPSSYPPPCRETAALPASSVARAARSELAQLRRLWAQAREAEGRTVEIVGAAGSGKSRLLAMFAEELAQQNALVLSVRCRDNDWAPFSTLKRLLEGHVAGLALLSPERRQQLETTLREAAGPMAAQIGLLSPRLAELFCEATTTLSQDDAQQVFVAAVADFLASYLEAGGCSALVIDDSHWLDASSMMVLARVAARLCGHGHMVVCSTRDDTDSRATLDRFRSSLVPERLVCLQLGAMTERDADDLVREYLGLEAHPPRELVQQLRQLSDGTPLNMLELIRLALEGGHLRPQAGVWRLDPAPVQHMPLPVSSQTLIERRVAGLDEPALQLLRSAAVLRGSVDVALLAELSELEPERVQLALDRAVSEGLLELDAQGTYSFVHDCIWEALLRALPEPERRLLHQRAADILYEKPRDGADHEYALARHYAAGSPEQNPARTFEVTWRAARRALQACDDMLALSLLRSAAEAAQLAAIAPDVDFHVALAETSLRTGATRDSLLHFERALARCQPGFERAYVLGRVAWVHHLETNAELSWRSLEAALAECGRKFPANDGLTFAISLRRWLASGVGIRTGKLSQREAEVLCGLYAQCMRVSVDSGFPLRGLSSVLLMAAVSKRLKPCRLVVQSELFMAFGFAVLGAGALSRARFARAEALAQELADPIAQTLCHQLRHVIAAWSGDIQEAERHARVCVVERSQWMELGELCLVCLGMHYIEVGRGRLHRALEWVQYAIDRVREHGHAPAVFSLVKAAATSTLVALGRTRDIASLEERLRFIECAPLQDLGCFASVSYQSRIQLLTERADLGDEFEALVEEFNRQGHNPKQVHLAVVVHYIHVAHARVHQCLCATPEQRRALLPRLERALADLEAAVRIEALRSHALVVRAAYLWLSGSEQDPELRLVEAERLARRYSAVWVSHAVARLRAHIFRAAGEHDAARDQAKVAALWARNYGQATRLRIVEQEFGLAEIVSDPARSERDGTHTRRHLDALLRIGQANSRELGPERQARLILDELLNAIGAARALLFMHAEPGNSLTLRAGRSARGEDLDGGVDYDRELVARVYATGQTQVGAGRSDRSCLVIALVLREQAVGVLYLDRSHGDGGFRPEDAALLQALANQVPIALELGSALRERERLQHNLRQAQKMEAIGRLAAGIAHDFNNVLAAIQFAAASLATLIPPDSDGYEELIDIRDSARRGAVLTHQLLTFSRDKNLSPRRIVLGEVVHDVLPMLRRLIPAEVRIDVQVDEAALVVLSHPSHLERVLLNLCQNASDAMHGSGSIAIRVARAPEHDHAELLVADTGPGMNDEVRQRLFEPFFTTKTGGTGLGLANVYAIVQQCKGHIDVTSELGMGSSFRICLPLAPGSPGSQGDADAGAADGGGRDLAPRPTVLVVDDDESARRSLERLLKRAGYEVLAARDGEHALSVIEERVGSLDLLITDIHMPGMTGAQLAAALRQRDPEHRMLFISGDARDDLLKARLIEPHDAFLRKPVEERELLTLIERVLKSVVHARSH
ncbi:MAG TPA: ATP-binding protein [Polyangiales bacterium]|nr:ATP-binding protein [Polyangiales bacterium]